jgi:flagellar biosynthesis/type III secretory pathway protein FliH
MSGMPTVRLAKTIKSLKVIQTTTMADDVLDSQGDIEQGMLAELESQKQQCTEALQILEAVAIKLQSVYEKAIVEHRQAIAKLAVEIARKILVQKVKDGDYQIESIIQEALNSSPTRQDIVVRLNPQDLAKCQQMQQQGQAAFAGVKFVADPGIGPAQCVVDTPKGKIESLIDEHLEQVERTLSKAVCKQ